MAVFKCKMCGATLEINQDGVVTCAYCGTKQTLPKNEDDQRAAAFNRGNYFRRIGDFDKAMAVYERIVREDQTDAEAHWCCALCRFGIEYVKDPATGEYIPTCHRASFDSFLEDADFKAALEHSDGITRRQYKKDAEKIAEVQQSILEISRSAEEYDVFICYKETDEHGDRTADSVLAQEIYYRLTDEGRKVFFSRITLEEVIGKQYEPYIFAALQSARIMIVLGTKAEYLNAVWVRNEWSRFLALMKTDRQKLLLPCYRDMSPYDMPDQLSALQSYDMAKIGFLQDLTRRVARMLDAQQLDMAKKTASLLKRAFLFLEDGDWQSADEYCEKVLEIDPECAQAFLGKLMAELHVRKQDKLKICPKPFDDRSNYKKALLFADAPLHDALTGYNVSIRAREKNPQLKVIYQDAVYSDAVKLMGGTRMESYQEALEKFEAIPDWKDSRAQISVCRKKIAELKARKEREEKKAQKEQTASSSKIKALPLLVVAIISIAVVIGSAITTVVIPDSKYGKAVVLMEAGQYTEAIAAFDALAGYKDSYEKIEECEAAIIDLRYQDAIALMQNGQYEAAITAFEALKDYKESSAKIAQCEAAIIEGQYQTAILLLEELQYEDAITAFEALGTYKDSAEYAELAYFRYKMEKIKTAKIGDYVLLGSYEQDNDKNNGKEDIEWLVLDIKDGKALVLSKHGLDLMPFNLEYTDVTWETCTLRQWLNEDFMDKAFTADEKAVIPIMTVPADRHPDMPSANPGNPTQDQMFILSFVEVLKYLPTDDVLRCMATDYVEAKTPNNTDVGCTWCLRTPSSETTYLISAVIPLETGGFMRPKMGDVYQPRMGIGVEDDLVIRPAMWIDMGT